MPRSDTFANRAQDNTLPIAEKPLELQPHLAMPPRIDATERYLLRVFLPRYITWCARRRRFAAMQGAARLLAEC
jgi:hypothetical protein